MSRLSLKKPTKDPYDKGEKLVFVGTKLIMSHGSCLAIHLGLSSSTTEKFVFYLFL